MRVREALSAGYDRLRVAGIDEAQVECEHMLMELLKLNRAQLLYSGSELGSTAKSDQENGLRLTIEQEKQFLAWLSAREKRIPLAYLLGDTYFYSLKLKVGPGCLIPRPETELLVEKAAECMRADNKESFLFMDMATGSGAIACALLSIFPKAKALCVDISESALEIARMNVSELGFGARAELIQSDLFLSSYFLNAPRGGFDLILSNPPYLTGADMDCLQPEVAHEPRLALDGGADGLEFYRRIIKEAKNYLKPNGWLSFEMGAELAPAICEELKSNGYKDLRIFKDHQEIERVVIAKNKG